MRHAPPTQRLRDDALTYLAAACTLLLAAVIIFPIHADLSKREAVRAEAAQQAMSTPSADQEVLDFRKLAREIYGENLASAYSLPAGPEGTIVCAAAPSGAPRILYLDRLAEGPAGRLIDAFPLDGLEAQLADYCFEIIMREQAPVEPAAPDALTSAPSESAPQG